MLFVVTFPFFGIQHYKNTTIFANCLFYKYINHKTRVKNRTANMNRCKEQVIINQGKVSLRKESFDTLKFFLAFFVVIIHTGFTGWIGLGSDAISRIAVPLFFMITGYYLPTMTEEKFKKHFHKVIYLTVISTLFYSLFSYAQSITGESSYNWFTQTFNMKNICLWLLFNFTKPIAGHLWYFYALLYVLIIIYIGRKTKRIGLLYMFLPLLFLGNYILSYFLNITYRNFLFIGLPYVLLGCLFRNNEKQFKIYTMKSPTLILSLLFCCLGLGLEMLFYKYTDTKIIRDHFLFTLPMAICVFTLALKHPHWGANSLLTTIGKKYSAHIYIMHLCVIKLIPHGFIFLCEKDTYEQIAQSNLFQNSYPFLVFGTTLIIAFVFNKLWSLFLQKTNTKQIAN